MNPSQAPFFTGAHFDRFLQAPIAEERNGTMLTVLSALARLDVDPWEEAATLARLPVVAATRKLGLLLAALPNRPIGDPDSGIVALRLIALLPDRVPAEATRGTGAAGVGTVIRPPILRSLIVYLIVMGLMFACEWLVTNSNPPPVPARASPPSASTAPAPLPPAAAVK